MTEYIDWATQDYTYWAQDEAERQAEAAHEAAREYADKQTDVVRQDYEDSVNDASDKVTETKELSLITLAELEQAFLDFTTGEKVDIDLWAQSFNWETQDYTYWAQKEVEEEAEEAKASFGAIIDRTINEAKTSADTGFDFGFSWLEEQFGIIGEALSFAFRFLATRLEDLLEIPARVLFDLFVGLFFEEEEIAET